MQISVAIAIAVLETAHKDFIEQFENLCEDFANEDIDGEILKKEKPGKSILL